MSFKKFIIFLSDAAFKNCISYVELKLIFTIYFHFRAILKFIKAVYFQDIFHFI